MTDQLNGIQFSDTFKKVSHIAQAVAKEHMHPHIASSHLLKALLHQDAGLQPLLKGLQKDIYYMDEWADVRMESLPRATRLEEVLIGDEYVKAVMEEADTIRLISGKDAVEPLHVLAALSTPGVGFNYEQLKTFPLQRQELLQEIAEEEGSSGGGGTFYGDARSGFGGNGTDVHGKGTHGTGVYGVSGKAVANGHALNGANSGAAAAAQQALQKYCVHKNERARNAKLDPIVGRDKEVRAMTEILSRRSKPNVLIIGEPGVGKTALVDGFTQAVEAGNVPDFLKGAQVFELDNGSLAAGAAYKGEIEERLKNIIAAIKQFDKAILFIDELHVLMDKQGAMAGAANLLKPELARGELTLIGATTPEEYRKYIEKDEALARRFDVIKVEEPDATTTWRMMQIVLPRYEQHHGIEANDETLQEAIRLARRYVKDRRLPDAAIDLTDHAMAALRITNDTGRAVVAARKTRFDDMQENIDKHSLQDWQWHYQQLSQTLSPILWAAATAAEDVAAIQDSQVFIAQLQSIYAKLEAATAENRKQLQQSDLAAIVAYRTGIPIGKVAAQEKERLLSMESILRKRVVGQDHAIHAISEAILESRAGLGKPGQPLGSFFFLGPTGTGKTELAKALADFLFQDDNAMIRFDMSEFKEEHSAAMLYGAPPGYVGYEEGGLLINKIRQQPYAVVLFDEIEKAHSSVFDIFLQIMDEGKLHDKQGRTGDFSNALILFTSNIGSQYVVDSFNKGAVPASSSLMEIMTQYFRPEFLGRLTEILPFAPMTNAMVRNILDIQLRGLYYTLDKQGISLEITDAAKDRLAHLGFTPQYGARPLAGVIRTELRRPLSRMIISGDHINPDDDRNNTVYTLDIDEAQTWVWKRCTPHAMLPEN